MESNQTVLVTGATSGIGKATCEAFEAAGWTVIGTYRKAPLADKNWHWLQLDLDDPDSLPAFHERVMTEFGAPEVLVNNAGYGLIAPIETADFGAVRRQFGANFFSTVELTRLFVPAFRARNRGTLVVLSSIGGKMAFPFFGYYNATKHAIEAVYESLHHELAHTDVQVRIIEPGFTQTNFATHGMDKNYADEPFYKKGLEGLAKRLETGTTATPPKVLGELIYRVSTKKTGLRHCRGLMGRPLLFLRRVLPEAWFLALVRKGTNPSGQGV